MFGIAILPVPLSITTAILVFARPVAHDAARKHLSLQGEANRHTLCLLNERVRRTAGQTGLPVLLSTDLISHSGGFGDQMSAAIQAAFEQGFDQILVVGNDCPAITEADIANAATELQAGRVVLGPDNRGGVYLLGLSRSQFDADTLRELPWQTNRLLRAIRVEFAAYSVLHLRTLGDINRAADVRMYFADNDSLHTFIVQLLRLIGGCARRFNQVISCRAMQPEVYRTGPLRAPPTPSYRIS